MKGSLLHLVNLALFVLLLVGSLAAYPALPDRIPTHFDPSGRPDGFAERSLLQWLMIVLVAGAAALVMYGSAWFLGRRPHLLSVPDRTRYRNLAPEAQAEVVVLIQRLLYASATIMLVLFTVLQRGTYDVALGRSETLPAYALGTVLGTVVLSLMIVPLLLYMVQQKIDALHRRHRP